MIGLRFVIQLAKIGNIAKISNVSKIGNSAGLKSKTSQSARWTYHGSRSNLGRSYYNYNWTESALPTMSDVTSAGDEMFAV